VPGERGLTLDERITKVLVDLACSHDVWFRLMVTTVKKKTLKL
jgi:hypothetical protein